MAGWYDENYKFRKPITLFSGGIGTQDFEIDLPSTWDAFWENIQATGYDIRVCDNDGVTLLTFDRDGFVYASKTLQIEIDNYLCVDAYPQVCWLYWGYAAATDGATPFVPASPESGLACFEAPTPAYTITCALEPGGATQPRNVITKGTGETVFLYWDVTDLLAKREAASEGSLLFEGIQTVPTYKVLLAGVDQTTMRTAVATSDTTNPLRILEVNGRIYIRTNIIGGTSATDYTLELKFTTMFNKISSSVYDTRTIVTRALLKVRDVSEV